MNHRFPALIFAVVVVVVVVVPVLFSCADLKS